MDEHHLFAALRYVALNPVRAGLVKRAADWRWSSTRQLVSSGDDGIVAVAPVLERIPDFEAFLGEQFDEDFTYSALRKAERVGRPVGSASWIADMEAKTGHKIAAAKRGRKPKR